MVKPILDYIEICGYILNQMMIVYYNEKDKIDVFIGIYGDSIDYQTTID